MTHIGLAGLTFLAVPWFLFAQDQTENPPPPDPQQQNSTARGGWRRADAQPPNPVEETQGLAPAEAAPSASAPLDQFGAPIRRNLQASAAPAEQMAIPPQLTIKAGTFVTVRVNQPLSSDRNQQGDAFSATLARPLVVDGVVVAEHGQVVAGRVVETEKAGRVRGVSRLAVELTELSLVDGQQFPIKTQLINRAGPTSTGRDAGAIAATTATGAAVGAAADWGRGAAIGAGVGAAAGTIGVLLTRGHETVIDPESVLTFRIESPVTFSTERASQVFRYVEREDYDRPNGLQTRPRVVRTGCGPYGCPPPSLYYAAPFYYGPGYYGPGLGLYSGPGFYYGSGFYFGRGFHRGFHR